MDNSANSLRSGSFSSTGPDDASFRNTLEPFLKKYFKSNKQKADEFVQKLIENGFTGDRLANADEESLRNIFGSHGTRLFDYLEELNKNITFAVSLEGKNDKYEFSQSTLSKKGLDDLFGGFLDTSKWNTKPAIIQVTLDGTKNWIYLRQPERGGDWTFPMTISDTHELIIPKSMQIKLEDVGDSSASYEQVSSSSDFYKYVPACSHLCGVAYNIRLNQSEEMIHQVRKNANDHPNMKFKNVEVATYGYQPFLIAESISTGATILAIPGSASFDDWKTNMEAWYASEKIGPAVVHSGFAKRANAIPISHIFRYLFNQWKTHQKSKSTKKFQFIITGHSLGGAVANILLTKLIHELQGEFPEDQCEVLSITFGAPYWATKIVDFASVYGGMSKPLQQYFINIIVDNDLIPFLLDFDYMRDKKDAVISTTEAMQSQLHRDSSKSIMQPIYSKWVVDIFTIALHQYDGINAIIRQAQYAPNGTYYHFLEAGLKFEKVTSIEELKKVEKLKFSGPMTGTFLPHSLNNYQNKVNGFRSWTPASKGMEINTNLNMKDYHLNLENGRVELKNHHPFSEAKKSMVTITQKKNDRTNDFEDPHVKVQMCFPFLLESIGVRKSGSKEGFKALKPDVDPKGYESIQDGWIPLKFYFDEKSNGEKCSGNYDFQIKTLFREEIIKDRPIELELSWEASKKSFNLEHISTAALWLAICPQNVFEKDKEVQELKYALEILEKGISDQSKQETTTLLDAIHSYRENKTKKEKVYNQSLIKAGKNQSEILDLREKRKKEAIDEVTNLMKSICTSSIEIFEWMLSELVIKEEKSLGAKIAAGLALTIGIAGLIGLIVVTAGAAAAPIAATAAATAVGLELGAAVATAAVLGGVAGIAGITGGILALKKNDLYWSNELRGAFQEHYNNLVLNITQLYQPKSEGISSAYSDGFEDNLVQALVQNITKNIKPPMFTSISETSKLKELVSNLSHAKPNLRLQTKSAVQLKNRMQAILAMRDIRKFLTNHFFLAVVGQKDCGKSTLIKKIIERYGSENDVKLVKTGYDSSAETIEIGVYYLRDIHSSSVKTSLILLDFPGSDGISTNEFFENTHLAFDGFFAIVDGSRNLTKPAVDLLKSLLSLPIKDDRFQIFMNKADALKMNVINKEEEIFKDGSLNGLKKIQYDTILNSLRTINPKISHFPIENINYTSFTGFTKAGEEIPGSLHLKQVLDKVDQAIHSIMSARKEVKVLKRTVVNQSGSNESYYASASTSSDNEKEYIV